MADELVPRREDGFAPIEDYAALGDGRTVALVALDGRIDWLPVPTMDATPAFAALLDPDQGGYIELAPAEPFTVERGYVADTNVLQAVYRSTGGAVRVTSSLNVGAAGRLPWGELALRVEGLSGAVPMRWAVRPGSLFGTATPWTRVREGLPFVTVGEQHLMVRAFEVGEPDVGPREVTGRWTCEAGQRGLLAVPFVDREPMQVPERHHIENRLERTIEAWRAWTERVDYDGPCRSAVLRSALALKLLIFSDSGAIVAAPTTSLPERLGGDMNWDYRYSWIRDSAFTIDALMSLGLHEEVHGALSWLLATVRETAPDVHVFYGLDGHVPRENRIVPLRGYRDSRPVRWGNSAEWQSQLGNAGDLLESVWLFTRSGGVLDEATAQMLASLADQVCDTWGHPDSGIWELDERRHYTISKMGCWTALDRCVRLAEEGHLVSRHTGRWAAERAAIRAWVDAHCWSDKRDSYAFYAGTDELDAAVLLAARNGFTDACPQRLQSSIEAVRRELGEGPLVYRYSQMRGEEGAFLACSFWLAEALTHSGRGEEGGELFSQLVALGNDVGLYAEEMDVRSRGMLGNFPQGLTHLSLINAARALAVSPPGGRERPSQRGIRKGG